MQRNEQRESWQLTVITMCARNICGAQLASATAPLRTTGAMHTPTRMLVLVLVVFSVGRVLLLVVSSEGRILGQPLRPLECALPGESVNPHRAALDSWRLRVVNCVVSELVILSYSGFLRSRAETFGRLGVKSRNPLC